MAEPYAKINYLSSPGSAPQGDVVHIGASVTSQYPTAFGCRVKGEYNGGSFNFTPAVYTFTYEGETQWFEGAFTMPSHGVTVTVKTQYYGADGLWHDDDSKVASVGIAGGGEEGPAGIEIYAKELLYSISKPRATIPATNIPVDSDASIFVWAKNNSSVAKTLGIGLGVTDPNGSQVYTYADWESGDTKPGEMHGFISLPTFRLSKVGTYYLTIYIYVYPDGTNPVTTFEGVLCTTVAAEEELETLKVDIVGAGYVTTSPASEEGKTTWHSGETGTFPYGTKVRVTAHPSSGYLFHYWSGEIVGGVSYDNPAYVQDMTEHRRVTCHFKAEEAPVPEFSQFEIVDYNRL